MWQTLKFSLNMVSYLPPVGIARSLVVGTLWFTYTNQLSIRHSCEHGDSLAKYGWTRHDGTSFGQQQIIDNGGSPCDDGGERKC